MAYFTIRQIYRWLSQISLQQFPQVTINPQVPQVIHRNESMRDYKEWTGKERLASLKKTKTAIAEGIIPPPTKCNRCGKTTGRIDYHNHDYSDPIKYLEQICQGCHTRLHRLENREANVTSGSTEIIEVVSNIPIKKEKPITRPNPGSREDMHQIRVDFTKALGLDWAQNPNPNSGYKYEHNLERRQQFLDEAIRLRDQYAKMVYTTGKGKDVLEKMERNLINRDRKTAW
jgi:hypothetical protein